MAVDIFQWSDIEEDFNGSIILGNGASIAVSEGFGYRSIRQCAIGHGLLTSDVRSIFDFFRTDDFELILRIVWQATNVNASLGIEDRKTEAAYMSIRDSLISAVRDTHCLHESISRQLPNIYNFLKGFNTVISLNYDLIVYWVMMFGRRILDYHAFKDCFVGSEFDGDWRRFREPINHQKSCTLVFYPHGNLILARDIIEYERKIAAGGLKLLEQILQEWVTGNYVPIFVSEGTREQKLKSIQSSYYLSTVYREILPQLSSHLVIYGWGLGDQDSHILDRILKTGIEKVAVSVFQNDQGYCHRVLQVFNDRLGDNIEVIFFDSESEGCWNHT